MEINDHQNNDEGYYLKMVSGAFYIPRNRTLKPLGEDAHFICADRQTIGVADGVGGWAAYGIDAGKYARELMLNSAIAAARNSKGQADHDRGHDVDPKRVLREAFSRCAEVEGSSTACIVAHNDGALLAANVGDSGFMVFRDGKLLYKSPIQQHVDCVPCPPPYQLGNGVACDRPECASEMKVEVTAGDIVVLGSDGLLDNLLAPQIEKILETKRGRDGIQPEGLAKELADVAYSKSLDYGGKRDDITVVVGQIIYDKHKPLSALRRLLRLCCSFFFSS
ncbi:PPM-type phosphatase domain containing protein [Trema orientale]|uniref:Protein phosphatase n=1 Tax=Trema orientale TaxID=63057 RepID=A0A2P5FIQ7_TREOI|nr:PPM-type phosphatase domain containing protein [Trema orientale]